MTDDVIPDDDIDKMIDAACDDGWDPAEDGWDDLTEVEADPNLPPLQDDELDGIREDLARWRSPPEFRALVAALHKRCRPSEVFRNSMKFLLEAWTLAQFTRHKPVDQVRLAVRSEDWPDGYVRIDGSVENVEITIALTEGRKMGDEYRKDNKVMVLDPIEDRIIDGIPAALEKAIQKKVAKRYGSKAWLVVYLNINDRGSRQQQIESAIAEIKTRQSFGAVFVLWKDKLL